MKPPRPFHSCSTTRGLMSSRWAVLSGAGIVMTGALNALPAAALPREIIGFEIIRVDPFPGHERFQTWDIDDSARIPAESFSIPSFPVIWINGQTFELKAGPLHEYRGHAYGISQSVGYVAGDTSINPYAPIVATLWTPTQGVIFLDTLPGYEDANAYDVNDAMWVVGTSTHGHVPIVWNAAAPPVSLGELPGGDGRGVARAINNMNEIVGSANGVSSSRPFLWRENEGIIDIGDPNSIYDGWANEINDFAEVVGTQKNSDNRNEPFLWRNGVFTYLPALTNTCRLSWNHAESINNFGEIVGKGATVECDEEVALLWWESPLAPDEWNVVNLNEPGIVPNLPDGHLLHDPRGINNATQIVLGARSGTLHNDEHHEYLISPYHYPLNAPSPVLAGERNLFVLENIEPGVQIYLSWGFNPGAVKMNRAIRGTAADRSTVPEPRSLFSVRSARWGRWTPEPEVDLRFPYSFRLPRLVNRCACRHSSPISAR